MSKLLQRRGSRSMRSVPMCSLCETHIVWNCLCSFWNRSSYQPANICCFRCGFIKNKRNIQVDLLLETQLNRRRSGPPLRLSRERREVVEKRFYDTNEKPSLGTNLSNYQFQEAILESKRVREVLWTREGRRRIQSSWLVNETSPGDQYQTIFQTHSNVKSMKPRSSAKWSWLLNQWIQLQLTIYWRNRDQPSSQT